MSQGNDLTVENLLRTVRNISVDDDDDDDFLVENNTIEEDDEEDDDNMAVKLGLVKKLEHDRSLLPYPVISIAGGFPAWLDPINLPSGSSTTCGICGDPLQFLLQLYAPVCEKKSAYHRTLYIFMCLSMKCLLQDQHEQRKHPLDNPSRSVKAFRCQLPRSNPFYAYEPSEHGQKVKAALCSWCRTWQGCSVCGNCKSARYCSKKHQAAHWRIGHNLECRNMAVDRQHINSGFVASNTIWPPFKIFIEAEPKGDTISENGGYDTALESAGHVDEEFSSLLDSFEADADKKSWATFQERVSRVPEQVLRHCRDAIARPVWPMSSVRPSKTDIPKCCYCGGPRCFELQILPQLLYYFGVQNDVDSLDWSTIVIYTCEASCDGSMAYKEEFAWVQLP
ncbi:hypothetical protein OROMI_009700 [Orobanche minor]